MTRYYHNTSLEGLRFIKKSGYLKAPLFVSKEGVPPVFISDLTLELDLRGFKLRKDPHPGVGEGHYYISKRVPVGRITNIEVESWGREELRPGEEIEGFLGDPINPPRKSIIPEEIRDKLVVEE